MAQQEAAQGSDEQEEEIDQLLVELSQQLADEEVKFMLHNAQK